MENLDSKLKMVELSILKEFIRICQEYNFQYYLVEGTCLGAIRHHGFIPWDDDIDVAMPREDYNTFMAVAQSRLPNYYFLQNNKTDPGYLSCFAKLRDSRTTFIEASVKDWKINHGVYIDIFPLDKFCDRRSFVFKVRELIYKAHISTQYSSSASKKMKLMQKLSSIILSDYHKTIDQYDLLMQSSIDKGMLANLCSAWGDKDIMPSEWYGKGIEVEFESITALVPTEYDRYLSKLYGNYHIVPPEDKRTGHHHATVIDLEKPYTEYD